MAGRSASGSMRGVELVRDIEDREAAIGAASGIRRPPGPSGCTINPGTSVECRRLIVRSLSGSQLTLTCALANLVSGATALQFRRFSSGSLEEHPSSKSSPIILNLNPRTFWRCMLMLLNWRQSGKSPRGEASLRREPFAEAGGPLGRPFSGIRKCASEWARRRRRSQYSEYACAGGFVLASTDSDFEHLLSRFSGANVVILRSCNYPTVVAGEVLRRNAIRIAELPNSYDRLIILER